MTDHTPTPRTDALHESLTRFGQAIVPGMPDYMKAMRNHASVLERELALATLQASEADEFLAEANRRIANSATRITALEAENRELEQERNEARSQLWWAHELRQHVDRLPAFGWFEAIHNNRITTDVERMQRVVSALAKLKPLPEAPK